jgi:hypothetical protein
MFQNGVTTLHILETQTASFSMQNNFTLRCDPCCNWRARHARESCLLTAKATSMRNCHPTHPGKGCTWMLEFRGLRLGPSPRPELSSPSRRSAAWSARLYAMILNWFIDLENQPFYSLSISTTNPVVLYVSETCWEMVERGCVLRKVKALTYGNFPPMDFVPSFHDSTLARRSQSYGHSGCLPHVTEMHVCRAEICSTSSPSNG